MSIYGQKLNTNQVTKKPFNRPEMIQNNAGGYVFKTSDELRLKRFLILGTDSGTFYSKEQELTLQNAEFLRSIIIENPKLVIDTLKDVIKNHLAPRNNAISFALALLWKEDIKDRPQIVELLLSNFSTATKMFQFLENYKHIEGKWSKQLCKVFQKWYGEKSIYHITNQILKYKNRYNWTHRDVLRMSHPKTNDIQLNNLYQYIVGKAESLENLPDKIRIHEEIINSNNIETVVKAIEDYHLEWELIPTQFLNNPDILKALLPNMGLNALIRNLNRFAESGLTGSNLSQTTKIIIKRLTDEQEVSLSKIHPVMIIHSMITYASGQGFKGSKTWTPNSRIVEALGKAAEIAINFNVIPTGKNILIGVDVSGSMNSPIDNMSITASQMSLCLALTLLKTESECDVVFFDTDIKKTQLFNKNMSYTDVLKLNVNGGGTNCSVPYTFAIDKYTHNNVSYDCIVVLTDNETWNGNHVFQTFEQYRNIGNKNCKTVVVGLTATEFNLFPKDDPNTLGVVGFDSSIINLITNFITGR